VNTYGIYNYACDGDIINILWIFAKLP